MRTIKITTIIRRLRFQFGGGSYPLFSYTHDMACPSWSLPALHACPGMVATDDSCICFGCYAQMGNYSRQNVLDCQAARFAWTKAALRFNPDKWIDTMISGILELDSEYFRIHDSGDFFSAEYVNAWYAVAKRCNATRFWAPTRSYHGKRLEPIKQALKRFNRLENVVIRPSALHWDEAAPSRAGFSSGSTALTSADMLPSNHTLCKKTMVAGGSCESESCRLCWDEPSESVAYLVHGRQGKHKVYSIGHNEKRKRAATVARFAKI